MGAMGVYDRKRKCPVCLKEFWAAKNKAVYCSAKCRQRAHRRPPLEERIGELYDDAHVALMGIIALTGGRDFDGFRAQQRLKALFMEIVNASDDKTRSVLYGAIKDDVFRLYRDTSLSRYRPENETVE